MKAERLTELIGSDFYTGIPDSQLKPLCDYLMDTYGIDPKHHLIAANEGNCVALAAGYHLATGKVPVVYMQNSGEGNAVNPAVSLISEEVYAIPVVFIIGWRGEPGAVDEPQHIRQGRVTIRLLEDMGIKSFVIGCDTKEQEVTEAMEEFRKILDTGRSVAFVIRKGAVSYGRKVDYRNENRMTREEVMKHIVEYSGTDPVISTTGKASRELFEIRESKRQGHGYDFLTVGSMGHASSAALGIAIHKPETKVWCVDGDGAVLMHMGAMAVIGANAPENMVHIILNNGAHETVGGMPTPAGKIDLVGIAKACGYPYAVRVEHYEDLDRELEAARCRNGLSLIEAKCSIGARGDLGRPTTTPLQNKNDFMDYLNTLE